MVKTSMLMGYLVTSGTLQPPTNDESFSETGFFFTQFSSSSSASGGKISGRWRKLVTNCQYLFANVLI
jgi:hypothetical protein